jgi:ferredoxin
VIEHLVTFDIAPEPVKVPTGALLSEAAQQAGVNIMQPCGGQGRCGRCTVQVQSGTVRRRSTLRLSPSDLEQGYALACQTVVEGDTQIIVPPQEKIERRLTTDRTVAEITIPPWYDHERYQSVRRIPLRLSQPSMDEDHISSTGWLVECEYLAFDDPKYWEYIKGIGMGGNSGRLHNGDARQR